MKPWLETEAKDGGPLTPLAHKTLPSPLPKSHPILKTEKAILTVERNVRVRLEVSFKLWLPYRQLTISNTHRAIIWVSHLKAAP
jgi:hypothetical protein